MQLMQNTLGLDAPAPRAFTADETGHGASATQFADQLVSIYTSLNEATGRKQRCRLPTTGN